MRQFLFVGMVCLSVCTQAFGAQTTPPVGPQSVEDRIAKTPQCQTALGAAKAKFAKDQAPKKAANDALQQAYKAKKASIQAHIDALTAFIKQNGPKVQDAYKANGNSVAFASAVTPLLDNLKAQIENKGGEQVCTSRHDRCVTVQNGSAIRAVTLDGATLKIVETSFTVTAASEAAFQACQKNPMTAGDTTLPPGLRVWSCENLHYAKNSDLTTPLDLTAPNLVVPTVESVVGPDPLRLAADDFFSKNLPANCIQPAAPTLVTAPIIQATSFQRKDELPDAPVIVIPASKDTPDAGTTIGAPAASANVGDSIPQRSE